jgi:hypothetical protein
LAGGAFLCRDDGGGGALSARASDRTRELTTASGCATGSVELLESFLF